jgi:hypothetical protein
VKPISKPFGAFMLNGGPAGLSGKPGIWYERDLTAG